MPVAQRSWQPPCRYAVSSLIAEVLPPLPPGHGSRVLHWGVIENGEFMKMISPI